MDIESAPFGMMNPHHRMQLESHQFPPRTLGECHRQCDNASVGRGLYWRIYDKSYRGLEILCVFGHLDRRDLVEILGNPDAKPILSMSKKLEFWLAYLWSRRFISKNRFEHEARSI
jgi:hypothetical protein